MQSTRNSFDVVASKAGANPLYGTRIVVEAQVIPLPNGKYAQGFRVGSTNPATGIEADPREPNWLSFEHLVESDKPDDFASRFLVWLQGKVGPRWSVRIEC